MTPAQLETWPTQQLQSAVGRYRDDYSESDQALVQAELERRGAATVGIAGRDGVEGFVDGFADSGGDRARSLYLAAAVCLAVGGIGIVDAFRLLSGQAIHPGRLFLLAGLGLGLKFLLEASEASRSRRRPAG